MMRSVLLDIYFDEFRQFGNLDFADDSSFEEADGSPMVPNQDSRKNGRRISQSQVFKRLPDVRRSKTIPCVSQRTDDTVTITFPRIVAFFFNQADVTLPCHEFCLTTGSYNSRWISTG